MGTRSSESPSDPATPDAFMRALASAPNVEPAALSFEKRFSDLKLIGEGAFGEVFSAWDAMSGRSVALKRIRTINAKRMEHLQDEFLLLDGIRHRNVVKTGTFFAGEDYCYFSMELVEGTDFLTYVRGNEVRLRSALAQIASGLAAIHQKNTLHRDIKPANVRVDRDGRVVLVDFGLASGELVPDDRSRNDAAGTPAYVSPEQEHGGAATVASEWYAVGVMLYEALTGQRPFARGVAKSGAPAAPSTISALPVPPDLDRLCLELLREDPALRPTGAEVATRSGVVIAAPPDDSVSMAAPASTRFVGRDAELQSLERAWAATRTSGRPGVVHVRGESGIGKSALVRRFLADREREGILTRSGRCHEPVSVPFKALTELIRRLANHLARLGEGEALLHCPTHAAALAHVFPTLERVPVFAEERRRARDVPDPQERRRRAFVALRELLYRTAQRRPLILHIDDLQWGDEDSGAVLQEVLAEPDPPHVLLIASYRSGEASANPCVRSLLALREHVDVTRIDVGPLPQGDAAALALLMLERDDEESRAGAARLARESNGNPFFLEMSASGETLEGTLLDRVAGRTQGERALLEAVAIAGRPMKQEIALRAANDPSADFDALASLRHARLVQTFGEQVDVFHDKIRETVIAAMPQAVRRARHRALAETIEALGSNPERLTEQWFLAGDARKAATWARTAAEQASRSLAFDHAAFLCRRVLTLVPAEERGERLEVETLLGEALANAGRGAEAADAFLRAAVDADPSSALDLRRRAAEQLLRSGYLDRGLAVARDVLRTLGPGLARSPNSALLHLVARRMVIGVRLLARRPPRLRRQAADDLRRIDTCWGISTGLALQDHIRAANLQAHHLLLALDAGEPSRLARAYSAEAAFAAQSGPRKEKTARRLLQRARDVAESSPETDARLLQMRAGVEFFLGRWRPALEAARAAKKIFDDECTGMFWEKGSSELIADQSLLFLGEVGEYAASLQSRLRDAELRGDLFALSHLRTYGSLALLAQGDVVAARRLTAEAARMLPGGAYSYQHMWALTADSYCDLYERKGEDALAAIDRDLPRIRSSLLMTVQVTRLFTRYGIAFAALSASASANEPRKDLLARASRCARQIEREKSRWAAPIATLIRAAISAQRMDDATAIRALVEAEAGFEAADMFGFAAAARRRRGEIAGGDEGRAATGAADDWMRARGVRDPARFSNLLAPGFPRR